VSGTSLDVDLPYCYVTTVGRLSGHEHEIEIWFTGLGDSLYLISGGEERSDWIQNLQAETRARVRVGDQTADVTARLPLGRSGREGKERRAAIDSLYDKYGEQVSSDRPGWYRDAFVVALDLKSEAGT